MIDQHPASLPRETLLAQCDERRLRRGGPGGQHRNKVETAVELTHHPTGVAAEANERRSQQQNRDVALRRLRLRLALAVRREPAPSPSARWAARCQGGRLAINPQHEDFAPLLAEALDHLESVDGDDVVAAERLGVSRTQLIKLLKLEPAALALLNERRSAQGKKPLV